MTHSRARGIWLLPLICFAHPLWADEPGAMGVVTGGIVDQFHRDDPNGNMVLLKEALEEEVRQRRLSTGAISPILNHMAPWITHLRDLKGDPNSLRLGLGLDVQVVSVGDIETLARVLNLPPAQPVGDTPVLAPAAAPKNPIRKPARIGDDREADAAFDEFNAALTPAPISARDDAKREWSASGAPLRR